MQALRNSGLRAIAATAGARAPPVGAMHQLSPTGGMYGGMLGVRGIGQVGVPEEYGQPKEGGTKFLGTPANHREVNNVMFPPAPVSRPSTL